MNICGSFMNIFDPKHSWTFLTKKTFMAIFDRKTFMDIFEPKTFMAIYD